MNIQKIIARQIFDSRGNPTVEVDIWLSNGSFGRAAVPAGASTGSHEAVDKRDGGKPYGGLGVTQAIEAINNKISPALVGQAADQQDSIDKIMLNIDGTPNKENLGANAILGVSLAVAKAAAHAKGQLFYEYVAALAGNTNLQLPMPLLNVINGGIHAADSTDIQEWMIVPIGATSFQQAMQMGSEVYQGLRRLLCSQKRSPQVGDEGGFAPTFTSNGEALTLLQSATIAAGYDWGHDIAIALDIAATELFAENKYSLIRDGKQMTASELIKWYEQLAKAYPIISIEDPLAEDDWSNWTAITAQLGDKLQIVGDDLLVTNPERLQRAINEKAANSILIKPNQIGSLTETINATKLAKQNGWRTVMSHRSGETEDTTIAHLAVGLGTGQIKAGAPARSERLAKYNELLRIAEVANLPFASNVFAKPVV